MTTKYKDKNLSSSLGVLLDQYLTWKEHIKLTENIITKSLSILYKARPYIDKRALPCLYYPYIHSYLNYAKTAYCRTNRTCLKKLQSHFCTYKYAHSQELLKQNNILNIY